MYGKLNIIRTAQGEAWIEVTDEALVRAARDGQRDAYTQLCARYHDLAYAYFYARLQNRDEAEDLTQEAFVRAYLALPTFRGESCWGAWIMRIVRARAALP